MAVPPVKSEYISSGPDLQLNYLEWGGPSAPPVLLIIGLTNFAYAWNETALALADRYRCVALNLRGHGDSGPSPEREYSFDLWDTDVQALVTTLGLDRPVIMGHSLGGRVAFVYGTRHPEHIQGVVVVDTGPGFPEAAAATVQKEFFGKMLADYESWEAGLAYRRLRQSPSISDEIMEARAPYALRQLPDGRVIPKHDPLLRDEWLGDKPPAQAHTWLWQDLANLQAPMLIVKGEKTPFLTHGLCDQMCAATEGEARWAGIPGTTHAIMDDNLPWFLKEVEPFTAACMGA